MSLWSSPTVVHLEISAKFPDDFIQNKEDCPEYERYG